MNYLYYSVKNAIQQRFNTNTKDIFAKLNVISP